MTFAGALVEAAILTDSDDGGEVQIQIQGEPEKSAPFAGRPPNSKPPKKTSPWVSPRSKAARKFELGKKMEVSDLVGEPTPEIVLTAAECKVLKHVVFRNYTD